MSSSNFGTFLDEGAQHRVYDAGGGMLIKEPKETCTYTVQQAQKALAFANDKFADFAIETKVVPYGDRYIIEQERIKGKILRDIDKSSLKEGVLSSIQSILSIHESILENTQSNFDVIGCQPFHHNKPTSSSDFGSHLEYLSKKMVFITKVLSTPILHSSNFMLNDNGEIVLIDDVYVDSLDSDTLYRQLPSEELIARKAWSKYNQFLIARKLKKLPD